MRRGVDGDDRGAAAMRDIVGQAILPAAAFQAAQFAAVEKEAGEGRSAAHSCTPQRQRAGWKAGGRQDCLPHGAAVRKSVQGNLKDAPPAAMACPASQRSLQ